MSEKKHECERDNSNIIFFSPLWKSWSLKIIPSGYDEMPEEYKQMPELQPVFIIIKYCPYCGVELK